jgi:hypothetical protein
VLSQARKSSARGRYLKSRFISRIRELEIYSSKVGCGVVVPAEKQELEAENDSLQFELQDLKLYNDYLEKTVDSLQTVP